MLKPIRFLFLSLLCCSISAAQSTTQPIVHVRDTDAQTDGAAVSSGDTLYLSKLPDHWTLSYNFGVPDGHTAQVYFSLDGAAKTACFQPPYVPNGRQPLNLTAGKHTVAVTVNGVAIQSTAITVATAPAAIVPATQPSDSRPVRYVANDGKDSNTGTDADHPKETVIVSSNLREYLRRGDVFPGQNFSGISHFDLYAYGDSSKPRPSLYSAKAGNITSWSDSTSYVGLHSITLDSAYSHSAAHGGFNLALCNGGNVRGSYITIEDVGLCNLLDGLAYYNVNHLTQTGGAQIGTVRDRCHFYNGVTNFAISGGTFGPSIQESAIRVSSNNGIGLKSGTMSAMTVVCNPSVDGKACFAIHCADGVTFAYLTANKGEFSFDSAGAGVGDKVQNCTIDHLTTIETKLDIKSISYKNKFTNLSLQNSTGEAISISDGMGHGSSIVGATINAPRHAIHYYTASDIGVGGVVMRTIQADAVIHDGDDSAFKDLGGNKLIEEATLAR